MKFIITTICTFAFTLFLSLPLFVFMVDILCASDVDPIVTKPIVYSSHVTEFYKHGKKNICKKDSECSVLAKAVVWESRGETQIGQIAVGYVVLGRTKDERWPDSIEGVVKQPRQFSFWRDKHKQSPPTKKDWTKGYVTAYNVIHGLVENPVSGARHYHSISVKPSWTKRLAYVGRIDNHIFYE